MKNLEGVLGVVYNQECQAGGRERALKAPDKTAGVIFDWDGVLLDSLGASYSVYNRIFEKVGARRLSMDEFLALQSPNWYEFYVKIGLPTSLWRQVDSEWMRLYKDEEPSLHPDAVKCLNDLVTSGFKLAVVSNGSKARVEGEVTRFGLASFFQSIVCGERREELKPSPVMLERALVVLGLDSSRAVYVGDAPADIQAAKNAKVSSIALARGPIQRERLGAENPDRIFGGLAEVTAFLTGVR
jgi:HAD superfamily hydrolase (TIGR01662 family)